MAFVSRLSAVPVRPPSDDFTAFLRAASTAPFSPAGALSSQSTLRTVRDAAGDGRPSSQAAALAAVEHIGAQAAALSVLSAGHDAAVSRAASSEADLVALSKAHGDLRRRWVALAAEHAECPTRARFRELDLAERERCAAEQLACVDELVGAARRDAEAALLAAQRVAAEDAARAAAALADAEERARAALAAAAERAAADSASLSRTFANERASLFAAATAARARVEEVLRECARLSELMREAQAAAAAAAARAEAAEAERARFAERCTVALDREHSALAAAAASATLIAELQRENDAHRAALTAVPSGWVAGANAMQRATKEAHDDRDSELARREAELAVREAEVHAMRVLIEDHLPTEPPPGPPSRSVPQSVARTPAARTPVVAQSAARTPVLQSGTRTPIVDLAAAGTGLNSASSPRAFAPQQRQTAPAPAPTRRALAPLVAALRDRGLDYAQTVLFLDCSTDNDARGRVCFGGRALHDVSSQAVENPYARVVSVAVKTLSAFDDEMLVPLFGFADRLSGDSRVAPLAMEPCVGIDGVLAAYRARISDVPLGAVRSWVPPLQKSIELVRADDTRALCVAVIVTAGAPSAIAPSVAALVEASQLPIAAIVIGVGDGPWDRVGELANAMPAVDVSIRKGARRFDNFTVRQRGSHTICLQSSTNHPPSPAHTTSLSSGTHSATETTPGMMPLSPLTNVSLSPSLMASLQRSTRAER